MKSSAGLRTFIRVYQDCPPFGEEHAGNLCREFDTVAHTEFLQIDSVQDACEFLDQSNSQTHDEVLRDWSIRSER
jgi:hypothetical protein